MTNPTTDKIDEILDKLLEDIVDANFNGYNYALNKSAKSQILALVEEANRQASVKGEANIYSWIISSYEDGEDIENIVSESRTRLARLTKSINGVPIVEKEWMPNGKFMLVPPNQERINRDE